MATVLDECTIEQGFMWSKGLNAKDIHKEIIPVYGGKCDFHLIDPLENHLGGQRFADG
jgi:hypothetical protein